MQFSRVVVEFEWDNGNSKKPKAHGLTLTETEEAFFDKNKIIYADWKHSIREQRITLLGKTKTERLLNITYTIRKTKIRVVTARTANRKEAKLYEKAA
jgi:uncharacterized protein